MIGRWLARLAASDFTVEHRSGSVHGNADALSRIEFEPKRRCQRQKCAECERLNQSKVKVTTVSTKSEAQVWVPNWTIKELVEMQEKDPDIHQVRVWLETNNKPNRAQVLQYSTQVHILVSRWSDLVFREGALYLLTPDPELGSSCWRLVAPSPLRRQIFHQMHHVPMGGHLGRNRTLDAITQRFYWPNCRTDVETWLRECDSCARVKSGTRHRPPMVAMTVGAPLDRVAIDILGELPETSKGNKYILVISDYFTKWTEAYAIPNQSAMTVADVIAQQFITRFGAPRLIHSYQGRNFESDLFRQLCKLLGVTKQRTTTHHPASDGQVERFNRTLLQMLRTVVNDHGDERDEHLPYVTAAYRYTKHETTGYSPFQLMFGRSVTLPLDLMVGSPPQTEITCSYEYVVWLQETMQQAHQRAWQNTRKASERQKNHFDARFHRYHFQIGEFVWRHNPLPGRRKLSKAWTGPFKIIDTPNPHHCLIQRKPDDKILRVHCDQLKHIKGDDQKDGGWY